MPAAVFSAFLAFTVIAAFTPGPNNILALGSGIRYGFRGSASMVAGICAGLSCVMVLCSVAVFSVSALSETVITMMKHVGCAYMLWLAWKVAAAGRVGTHNDGAASGFLSGFILQFLNIKIIVFGLAAFSGFILPYYDSYGGLFLFVVLSSLIASAGVLTWALAGSALQVFFAHHARIVNGVMGLMLAGCALTLLF